MSAYILSEAAVLDLEEIAAFIARENGEAAQRTVEKLYMAFALLARNPGMGHRRDDLVRLPVLFLTMDAYVIVYRRSADTVQIVAVTEGSRHLPRLLTRRAKTQT